MSASKGFVAPAQMLRRALGALWLAGLALASPAALAAKPVPVATVGGIAKAENSIQTSGGRIFVSSTEGLYELLQRPDGSWTKRVLPTMLRDGTSPSCYYLGITEYAGTLYTVCTEDSLNPLARKRLMGLDLASSAPLLQEVGSLTAIGNPNGLAADGAGNLYYAVSGLLYAGSIHRVTLSGPFQLREDRVLMDLATDNPNGVKFSAGQLYVSTDPVLLLGVSYLLRYPVATAGLGLPKVVAHDLGFYDDFSLLSGGGVLMADFLGGKVMRIDEATGRVQQSFSIDQPTSARVIRAPVTGQSLLLVTQMGSNQVTLLTNPDNWQPR